MLRGKFQPDYAAYPNLPHPPITIHGLDEYSAWGQAEFYNLHIIGYIHDEMVAEQWVSSIIGHKTPDRDALLPKSQ